MIELHGSGDLKDVDVEWAARLAQAGFVALAGCWQSSTVPPNTFQFYELTVRFIGCPTLWAPDGDAIAALIEAGRKQQGVRSDAVALYGMSAGARMSLREASTARATAPALRRKDVRDRVWKSTYIR